jgi:hypothetical protein
VESCPNIGGGEIRRRLSIGYLSLILTIAVIVFTIIFNPGQLRALVFLPALLMGITFFEAWDKTCIINAYFGIKNLGQKNQREKDLNSLIIQRTQSVKIIIKSIITAGVITVITYFV